jgi:hypothetical protein
MERYYTVRLVAWNCSCAAFAFAAFPGRLSSASALEMWDGDVDYVRGNGVEGEDSEEQQEGEWEFGGRSTDGEDGGAVPCCKHLLACVLAEKWEAWLGGFMDVRTVGREEMAGLACEG